MKYVGIVDLITNLTDTLNKDDIDLPIYSVDAAKLRKALGAEGYTFVSISDGVVSELVKIETINGELYLTRGQEQTEPVTFPTGAEVRWVMSMTAVHDIICQMECCPGVNVDESVKFTMG